MLLTLALSFLLNNGVLSSDYCDPKLCPKDVIHVGCRNYGDFDHTCGPYTEIIEFTNQLQNVLLQKMNNFRSSIAKALITPFKRAAYMATLQWHNELAGLAKFALRRCDNFEESCCNTQSFKYVSYTYGNTGWLSKKVPSTIVIDGIVQFWLDDHKNCSMEHITGALASKDSICRGYFTQIVQDRAAYLGCAMMRRFFTNLKFLQYSLLCNFSRGKIHGQPVYRVGQKTASSCLTGVNGEYSGLCSTQEKIYANYPE